MCVCVSQSAIQQPISEGFVREIPVIGPSLAVKTDKDEVVYSRSLSQVNCGARQNVSKDILYPPGSQKKELSFFFDATINVNGLYKRLSAPLGVL